MFLYPVVKIPEFVGTRFTRECDQFYLYSFGPVHFGKSTDSILSKDVMNQNIT